MIRQRGRAMVAPRLESLEAKTLLSLDGWQGYARDPQHTALSPVASAPLESIHWETPVDLAPPGNGGELLIHYGSPLVTAANTVLVPVKTGASGGFELQARSGADGTLRWTLTSDYALMPSGYDWTPSYSPTLTPANRLDFAGLGGTVQYTDTPDAAGPTPPATGRLAFFGLANYNANPAAYNSTIFINTPITADAAGDIFFGFLVTGSNPLGLTSGVARIGADGTGSWAPVVAGTSQVADNSAPALSHDGSTLYVLESTGNYGSGKLVALDSSSLAVEAQVTLMDPNNTANPAVISNDATASPTVGPDGDVYIGVLEDPGLSNHDRGWLLHFSGDLSTAKIPGAFGWDDTASIVPASMVPSYHGSSSYLLMTKYNNYAGAGGDGVNKLAILDPNAMMDDPVTGACVMQEVLTIAGPTPDPEFLNSDPNAVREWCINTAVVDPATDSVLANSEDGKLYRWDLATNTFTQQVTLTAGVGEAYTPTLIGVDGTVYAINDATLFAIGVAPASAASFVGSNTTTQGNWIGAYGAQGYNVIGNAASYPAYAIVMPSGQSTYTWAASTSDPRALQTAGGTGRTAACWFSDAGFSIDVDLTGGQTHALALYAVDWDGHNGRSEQIQITDAATGSVLDTEAVSSFSGGAYLQWNVSGHIVIKVTTLNAYNAVLSGLFFDPAATTYDITDSSVYGHYVQVEGAATLTTSDGTPCWTAPIDACVRFRATCAQIEVFANFSDFTTWQLSIDGVSQGGSSSNIPGSSGSDFVWKTVGTGLDPTTEHEYMIRFGSTAGTSCFVNSIRTYGGTGLDTAVLAVRPLVEGIGDSVMTGAGIPNFDSTLSFMSDLGSISGYQVSNRAIGSLPISGPSGLAQTDLSYVTGLSPAPTVIYFLDGVADVLNNLDLTQFGVDYAACLSALRSAYPSAWIVCAEIQPGSPSSTAVDPYNAEIATAVTNAADDRIVLSSVIHDLTISEGLTGYHPHVAESAEWAAAMQAEIDSLLGGSSEVAKPKR